MSGGISDLFVTRQVDKQAVHRVIRARKEAIECAAELAGRWQAQDGLHRCEIQASAGSPTLRMVIVNFAGVALASAEGEFRKPFSWLEAAISGFSGGEGNGRLLMSSDERLTSITVVVSDTTGREKLRATFERSPGRS